MACDAKEDVVAELEQVVGKAYVTAKKEDLVPYRRDSFSQLAKNFFGEPAWASIAVFPNTIDEVQGVMRVANKYRIPVTPITFGSNMGGLAIPTADNCIMLDLKRLNRIIAIDEESMTATIEPSVTFAALDNAARKHNLRSVYKDGGGTGSLIGNIVSANMRPYNIRVGWSDVAVSLEVVLPNGELLRTGSSAAQGYELGGTSENPYARLSWGPDLSGIFRGSIGFYGVVVRATVRLFPVGEKTIRLLFRFADIRKMLQAFREIQVKDIGISALATDSVFVTGSVIDPRDRVDPARVKKISEMIGRSEWFLTVQLSGFAKRVEVEEEEVNRICMSQGGVVPNYPDEKVMQYLSDMVTDFSETSMHHYNGGYLGFWCSLPFSRIAQFVEQADPQIRALKIKDVQMKGREAEPFWTITPVDRGTTWVCGPSLTYDATIQAEVEKAVSAVQAIFMSAIELGGTIPLAVPLLTSQILMPTYNQLLVGMKKLLDPNNVLVPNKLCKVDEKDD